MAKLVFIAKKPTKTTLLFDSVDIPRERLLAHYLVYSAAYYVFNESLITDYEYDILSEVLFEYVSLIKHVHSYLIDVDSLGRSSSGYYINFPSTVLGCAQWLINYKQQNKRLPDL